MSGEEFQALLLKYRQGRCTPEEIRKIHLWFEALPEAGEGPESAAEKEALEQKLWEKIRDGVGESEQSQRTLAVGRRRIWLYGAAASLLLLLTVWGISAFPGSNLFTRLTQFARGWTHEENNTNRIAHLKLDDGSEVTLLPGSSLAFPKKFNGEMREVHLEKGNAFFEVKRQTHRPFFVYHGNLVTRVLGTSFWIRNDPVTRASQVEVVTGKVSVYAQGEKENSTILEGAKAQQVVLTSRQRLTYDASRGVLQKELKDLAEMKPPGHMPAHVLYFNNNSLPEIRAVLEHEYGMEMVLLHDNFDKCTFTGDVSGLPLEAVLELICKSIGNSIEYEITGMRILVSGEGCG